eukprot:Amastigsp_a177934_42.p3 type:complete len:102 gc:universal Amastigsp_a177934_42:539-234(-)
MGMRGGQDDAKGLGPRRVLGKAQGLSLFALFSQAPLRGGMVLLEAPRGSRSSASMAWLRCVAGDGPARRSDLRGSLSATRTTPRCLHSLDPSVALSSAVFA